MSGLAWLLIGVVGQVTMGIGFVTFLDRWTWSARDLRLDPVAATTEQAERLGFGLLVGIGLTAWLLLLISFCGYELGPIICRALAIAGLIGGGAMWWWGGTGRNHSNKLLSLTPNANPHERAFCRVSQLVLIVIFLSATVQPLLTPQHYWDERAAFAIKGLVMFEDRSIRSPALADPDFVVAHPRYPLLIPLAELHIYGLLGEIDDRWSKLIFPMLYAGLVLSFVGVVGRTIKSVWGWAAGLGVATLPLIMPDEYGFLSGQADAPVGAFHCVSGLLIWSILKRFEEAKATAGIDRIAWERDAFLAGFCAAMAAFTKDEGIAHGGVTGIALAMIVIGAAATSRRTETPVETPTPLDSTLNDDSLIRNPFIKSKSLSIRMVQLGIALAAVAIAFLLPWLAHRRSLPMTTEMNYFGRMTWSLFASRLETLGWTIPHLLYRMFVEWQWWGLHWWLLALTLCYWPRRAWRPSQVFVMLSLLGSLASLAVAGMLAPAQLDEHIGGSSNRFLMQISPLVVLFAVGQFREADNETVQNRQSPSAAK